MEKLKEAYGQSEALDLFVEQATHRFSTYFKVTINNPTSKPAYQERYFAFEDAATEYYNKLKEDLKQYGWDRAEINLLEVNVVLEEDEIDSYMEDIDNEDIDFGPEIEEEDNNIEEE